MPPETTSSRPARSLWHVGGTAAFAGRIRELLDQGHSLASALRILGLQDDILGLQDDLAAERALTARLQRQLHREHDSGQGPTADNERES